MPPDPLDLRSRRRDLFTNDEFSLGDGVEYARRALAEHGAARPTWVVMWSGGKDSSAVLTLTLWLISTGQVPAPDRVLVLRTNTRMELPPLEAAALQIARRMAEVDFPCEVVYQELQPDMMDRFWVYILGRGVAPPKGGSLRWCTRKMKMNPSRAAMEEHDLYGRDDVLVLTGVRRGESAARDARIAATCDRESGECGQGFFHVDFSRQGMPTLAPIDLWRACSVWDWLAVAAPREEYGAWPTAALAQAYGDENAPDLMLRTGCLKCNLVGVDRAFQWAVSPWGADQQHLAPLDQVGALLHDLDDFSGRHRMPLGERTKGGALAAKQGRVGPLSLERRLWGLSEVLRIQAEHAEAARAAGAEPMVLVDAEEEAVIRQMIADGVFPRKWSGDEPLATELYHELPLIDVPA